MTTRKRGESLHRVIVVLNGEKVAAADKQGLVPLLRASKYASNNKVDEILALTLLPVEGSGPSSSKRYHGDHRCNYACGDDPYIRFLRHQVKFPVKVAAGYQPKDIIIEEANNVGATWIILDSSFAKHLTFRLIGVECNVSLVTDGEGAVVDDHWTTEDESSHSLMLMEEVIHNPKSPKMMKGSSSTSQVKPVENETESEPLKENETPKQVERTKTGHNLPCSNISPQQLSWEVISEITKRFSTRASNDRDKNYSTYMGCLDQRSVLVKRLGPHSTTILEAEMRAASCMNHKNISVITGYHQSENGTILIFPLLQGMTLDRYIWGSERRELKFEARLKIAITIAQGVRYMHEECPQWPVVHGELQPRSIFIRRDLQPMISGFGKAAWLHNEQLSFNSKNRYTSTLIRSFLLYVFFLEQSA
ncbi:putative U-box domain-containing protein 50 [Hibiscus syriacus]|uniref:putative U-box domain-containing protein 50 n=1 Tax=Hibiscus syriacus TaxID=106335 RepID=UPI0019219348|nr:putative U-box domain-containing protein 50 [Hibiscus syriacus]